jgi:Immunity protein 8
VRAQLKGIVSPDASDPSSWQPRDPENFGVFVQALIGPAGQEGCESFDMTVCTPRWFAERGDGEIRTGLHHIFVPRYDFPALKTFMERQCQQIEAGTWQEIAQQLRLLGHWEFEGYRER